MLRCGVHRCSGLRWLMRRCGAHMRSGPWVVPIFFFRMYSVEWAYNRHRHPLPQRRQLKCLSCTHCLIRAVY
ncbi:unnamed protein product [Acanthoscelides obtectus]|uniref:Uncharacterized protein n=1 Tax=Acanthoscelides obtectus TaxID=200917 RepID=A0A9P0PHS9_ACAOB|nr:unnamed protein product [Acanthoscelides obtectus]CAK1676661.1 hypothetical protein AOBTE_LOCUS30888 [Acanthoscelides obtectus]